MRATYCGPHAALIKLLGVGRPTLFGWLSGEIQPPATVTIAPDLIIAFRHALAQQSRRASTWDSGLADQGDPAPAVG
jgi:hypothetical protein